MKRGAARTISMAMALALVAGVMAPRSASAQGAAQCGDFTKLRADAQQKAAALQAANKARADRKEVCTLVSRFAVAEAVVLKFLIDNKTWCGVPDQAIAFSKASHEKTLKFRTMACSDAPQARPKPPSLSDAINTPSVDTGKNTKTGPGTFDTLTGNPLAK